jgi:hypothetical protein
MENPLVRLLISSQSVNKHGYHRNLVGIIYAYGMSSMKIAHFKQFQRRRFFLESTNQKQELHVVAMFANRMGRNEQSS